MTDTQPPAPPAEPHLVTAELSPFERYRHVVIEGPIGAGKTSLTNRLADQFGVQRLLENAGANPFLERFYRDPPRYALPTQLSFLFGRIAQLRELAQRDAFLQPAVSDFLLDKDPLFSRLTLADDEFTLYRQIFDSLQPHAPVPDLVIYLQAPPEALIERVRTRANPIESPMTGDYLRALADAYSEFFHHYDASPLLIVNTAHLNPAASDEDLAILLRQVQAMRGRREFFGRG